MAGARKIADSDVKKVTLTLADCEWALDDPFVESAQDGSEIMKISGEWYWVVAANGVVTVEWHEIKRI